MNQKVISFFEKNPDVSEVHEALGILFTDKEDAQKYLGGISGHVVTTHTRESIKPAEKLSDAIKGKIKEQEEKITKIQDSYEKAEASKKEPIMKELNEAKADLEVLSKDLKKQLKEESKTQKP